MVPDDDKSQTHLSLASGTMVSHYRIVEKIGAGGMGEVYLAEDTELNRKVALKFLPPDLCRDADCRARFKREAQAAAKLSHPNIVTIHDVAEYHERPYIVMEYLGGKSLQEIIQAGDLPLAGAIDLAVQITEGLQAAHQAGVIHRDIKPANIVVTAGGRARILDFGLAAIKGTEKLTQTGSTLGTLGYMSPEQTRGEASDQRSDIFSFGVILYEMITGRLPFHGEHEAAILYAIAYEEPEPLARYKTGVPDELQRIVSKALAKSKDERYQHADDLLADLRAFSKQGSPAAKKPRRDLWNRYVVTSAVAVILVITGYWLVKTYVHPSGGTPEPQRKMLAVLPFENLGSPDDEYFADGITDEITAKLAAIHDLGVISRTSTMLYKRSTKNLQRIANELGVDYILEGTILWDRGHDTSRVRILPQLIRVSDDTHLWAETYQRPLTDIFALQADIAARIVEAMNVTLLGAERVALESTPTRNMDAYRAYLRGLDYRRGSDFAARENSLAALRMFQRAVELDSTFAQAFAQLAYVQAGMYHYGHDPTAKRLAQAKAAADRALAIQPNLPQAHIGLCYYYYWGYRDYEQALRELTLADVGRPNDPEILLTKAYIWRRQGKFKPAVEQMIQMFVLNPRDAQLAYVIGETFAIPREYASADKFFNQAISLAPDQTNAYLMKQLNYCLWRADTMSARATLASIPEQNNDRTRLGWFWLFTSERNYAEAINQLALMSPVPEPDQMHLIPKAQLAAMIYDLMHDPNRARAYYDSARVILENELTVRPDDHRVHSSLGMAYAGLGRKDDAIREGQLGVELFPVAKDAYIGPCRVENLAQIYVMVGEYDSALDQIEYLLSIPSWFSVPLLRLDPRYDPLRTLPRYQKMVEKYGA